MDWAAENFKSTDKNIRSVAKSILIFISESDKGKKHLERILKKTDDPAIRDILRPDQKKATAPIKLTNKQIAQYVKDIKKYGSKGGFEDYYGESPAYDAAVKMANSGNPKAIRALAGLITDKRPGISEAARMALSQSASPLATQAIIRMAKSNNDAVMTLLYAQRTDLVPYYITLLKSKNKNIVAQAIETLGSIHDNRATKNLVPLLSKSQYRSAVLSTLAQIKDPAAIDAVIPYLKSNMESVVAVLVACGQASVEKNMPKLSDSDPVVSIAAASVLQQVPSSKAVDLLIAASASKNSKVREAVINALIAQKDPKAKATLISALKDNNAKIRRAVAYALVESPDAQVAEAMEPLLKDKNKEIRACAAVMCGQMGDQSVKDDIIRILIPDPSDETPVDGLFLPAMRAAGILKDKRAVTPILFTLGGDVSLSSFEDAGEKVYSSSRNTKLDALRSITGKDFGEAYYRWMAYWVAQGNRVRPFGYDGSDSEDTGEYPSGESDQPE